jgi:putative tryptophan/tyrosine transport system substrate-binding protein
VFAVASDAIGSGYVKSLARPGGNITGLTELAPDLAGKRLEILRSIVPGLRTLAIMADAGNPGSVLELGDVQASAQVLGLDVIRVEIQQANDIAPSIETLMGRAGSLYVTADALTFTNHTQITSLAFAARLPVITGWPALAMGQSLVSYGPNVTDMFRRAAEFVDKILHGTKPSDMPVEQPTKFELLINLKTAKALGLTIPQSLLATADEVIE